MLPILTTHVPVMSRIANGADLMLPGVIIDESKAIKVGFFKLANSREGLS